MSHTPCDFPVYFIGSFVIRIPHFQCEFYAPGCAKCEYCEHTVCICTSSALLVQ